MYHEFINHYAGCLLAATQAASRRCRYPRLGREEARESQAPPVEKGWKTSAKAGQWIYTLQGTTISPKNGILKMIFLSPRWDMLVPWRAYLYTLIQQDNRTIIHSWIFQGTFKFRCWCPLIMASDDWQTCFALASEMRISPQQRLGSSDHIVGEAVGYCHQPDSCSHCEWSFHIVEE